MIGNKKLVACCCSRVNDDACHKLITLLSQSLAAHDYKLFVYSTCSDLFWNNASEMGEKTVFELIDFDVVDAVVVFSEKIKNHELVEDMIEKSKKRNIPFIIVDGEYDGCINLSFDYESGFAKIVEHVITHHGVTDIHMMGGIKGNSFSETRNDVFRRVLKEHGIPCTDDMISYGDFWTIPTKNAMAELFKRDKMPKAIICANDVMAITVCTELIEHGYKVPEDIIVTGFDGIDDIKYFEPRISSCMTSHENMAKRIAEIIMAQYTEPVPAGKYLVEPELILAESCGCHTDEKVANFSILSEMNTQFTRFQEEQYNLYNMTAKIMGFDNFNAIIKEMKTMYFYDMCCILKAECIDETANPLVQHTETAFSGKKYILYDADIPVEQITGELIEIPDGEQLSDMDHILSHTHPVFFCAINYLDIPLGYVCFHFHNYDIANYRKIPQITNALSNALGSYRSTRYQRYMSGQIEEMYRIDSLTGLYNRNGLVRSFKHMQDELGSERCMTVLLADLDGLKSINDTYGHDEGDNAIRTVAYALRDNTPSNAVCARLGGDELMAIIPDVFNVDELNKRIESYLAGYNQISGKPYSVSASIGGYIAENIPELDFEEVIRNSDRKMYAVKVTRPNRRKN